MAMTNIPWGMQPLFFTDAQKKAMMFPITNNYGTALYVQDPALAVPAGTIEHGATTGAWLGVILGLYKQELPQSNRPERLTPVLYMAATPGATYNYFALVAIDPFVFYTAQEDGAASSLQFAASWACLFRL